MAERSFDGSVPGVPGATIYKVGNLPEHLEGGTQIGPCTDVAPGALLFEVPGVARYLVRDGTSIEVAAAAGADRSAVELFLHGSARGALIHQRGELALTATTVIAPNRKCVAICGPSAFGKSTLAATLCQRGWQLVAEDITRVSWNGAIAVAWPSHTSLKLWRDACDSLGANCNTLERVREGLEKFHFPVAAAATPAALAAAVRLRSGPAALVTRFSAMDCAALLAENTFRPRLIAPLGRRAEQGATIAGVASVCQPMGLDGARRRAIAELADSLAEAMR
jgi:hypothetical protein